MRKRAYKQFGTNSTKHRPIIITKSVTTNTYFHNNNNNNNNKLIYIVVVVVVVVVRKDKEVDLYSAYRQYNSTTKRSDVDHTELPANTSHLPFLRISIR